MKKKCLIIVGVAILLLCLGIVVYEKFFVKEDTVQKDSDDVKNEITVFCNEYEEKYWKFGKSFENEEFNLEVKGIYINCDVNEKNPQYRDFEVVYEMVIEGAEKSCDYGKEYGDFSFQCKGDKNYKLDMCGRFKNDDYYLYSKKEGELHVYCYASGKASVGFMKEYGLDIELTTKDYDDNTVTLMDIPFMISDGLQYYTVDGNDIIVTSYGVFAKEDFKISTMQVYRNDGMTAFGDEEMEKVTLTESLVPSDYVFWHLYSYDSFEVYDVEYIDVNGNKYYPK